MAIYDYWPHCPDAENQTGIYVFSYHYFSAWAASRSVPITKSEA